MKVILSVALLLLFAIPTRAQQTVYVDSRLPNAHPLKRELSEKLEQSDLVTVVPLPEQADLTVILDQTAHSLGACSSIWLQSQCGHRGRAVLKERITGKELWTEEKGGAWQMSGWSDAKVGRKLGDDLVKFLRQRNQAIGGSR